MDEKSNARIWSKCRTLSKPTFIHHLRVSGSMRQPRVRRREYWLGVPHHILWGCTSWTPTVKEAEQPYSRMELPWMQCTLGVDQELCTSHSIPALNPKIFYNHPSQQTRQIYIVYHTWFMYQAYTEIIHLRIYKQKK